MEVSGKTAGNDDNLATLDTLCELCEEDNVNTPANGFCKECEQCMCNACFRQHTRATLCRYHTLLDPSASSEKCARRNDSTVKCKQHEADTIKYYCRTHEVVGCGDCIVSKHGGCKPEFIKDLSYNFLQNEEYKTFMNTLEKLICERKEFEKKIQENRKENEMMLEKALQDIKQFRLDINKYLDKVEKDITCQIRNVMEENDILLKKLENDCTMLSTKFMEITDMLNSELYTDNVLFIHVVECKPKLPESVKAFTEMKSKSMKKYEFVCDHQLRSIVASSQKLGTMSISTSAVFPQPTGHAIEKSVSQGYARENYERGHTREETERENVEGRYKNETTESENDQTSRKTEYGVNPLYSIESRERDYLEVEKIDEYDDEIESEAVAWSSSTSKRERDKGDGPLYIIESGERDYAEVEKIDEYEAENESEAVAWSSYTSKRERDIGVKPLYSIESGERDYLEDISSYSFTRNPHLLKKIQLSLKREKPLYSIESEKKGYLEDHPKKDEYGYGIDSGMVKRYSSTSKRESNKEKTSAAMETAGTFKAPSTRLSSIKSQRQKSIGRADMLGKGTVTDVREDGSVRVTWDNGRTGHYRVGVGFKDVTLI